MPPEPTHARRRSVRRPRPQRRPRFHLIDIENLADSRGRPTTADYQEVAASYTRQVGMSRRDRVVVACNPGTGLAAQWVFPDATVVTRHGKDGADLALLDALGTVDAEGSLDDFREVVVASGDGIFAGAAAQMAERGVRVTVVSRRGRLAKRLRLAADRTVFLSVASTQAAQTTERGAS